MKKLTGRFLLSCFALFAVILLSSANTFADVNVFAEGAYTTNNLVVYIYADTTVNTVTQLRSAGVKLIYAPSELTVNSVKKNESTWFLGNESYMDPDISTPGEIVFILGKLDIENPDAGVSGERVLLGKVTFVHTGLTSFTLNLDYGKRGPANEFKNFVDTATPANILDDTAVNFGAITVTKRGDADTDGVFTTSDMLQIKQLIKNNVYKCFADCDEDGVLTTSDMLCIKPKI